MFGRNVTYNESYNVKGHKLTCGWCSSIVAPNTGYGITESFAPIGYIYICPNCNESILFNYLTDKVFPSTKHGKPVARLPKDIAQIYEECRNSFAIGAYTSISLLARKLLMHVGVKEGAKENETFKYYVDWLIDNHFVPPKSKHLLDFIRKEGNEATHEIIIKTRPDAEKVIDFISMILTLIYEYADTPKSSPS